MTDPIQAHDLSAESALLGLALQRPDAVLPELRARVQPRDFFSRQHAVLYQAVLDLDAAGQPVEIAEVFARLERRADHGLNPEELARLRDYFGGAAGEVPEIEPLIIRLLARSRSRELAKRLEQLLEEARQAPEDLRRHLDRALAALLPLAQELGSEDQGSLPALLARLKQAPGRRLSGWPVLDAQERFFANGELALVLARTGHGKTNLMLNLAMNWLQAEPSANLAFYSLEMTDTQLAQRLVAMRRAKTGADGPGWGEHLALRYLPRLDVERLAADALRRLGGRKVGGIFVDSLTALMPPPQGRFHGRRDLELAEVCRRLKELAVALDCPVIAAVPARRDNLAEQGTPLRELLAKGAELNQPEVEDAIRWRRPRLDHLPEHGLEAHADVVLGLLNYVADFHEELDPEHRQVFKARPEATLELSALKHRGGALHAVDLEMEMKTGWIH
jgi:replicative DNA helicase